MIGGDSAPDGGLELGAKADMAVMNMYSRALTADEVAALYTEYAPEE